MLGGIVSGLCNLDLLFLGKLFWCVQMPALVQLPKVFPSIVWGSETSETMSMVAGENLALIPLGQCLLPPGNLGGSGTMSLPLLSNPELLCLNRVDLSPDEEHFRQHSRLVRGTRREMEEGNDTH